MNLLEKLTKQVENGEIKPKDTLQDWFDTLEDDDFEELERLVTLQEEDPENEECETIALLVMTLYSIETGSINLEENLEQRIEDVEEEEFFKLLNSFLFLIPFYYWLKQDLIKINTKLSFKANQENAITVTLTEYGK